MPFWRSEVGIPEQILVGILADLRPMVCHYCNCRGAVRAGGWRRRSGTRMDPR